MSSVRGDPELQAIRRIQDILGTLSWDAQARVLGYIQARITRAPEPHQPRPLDWPVMRPNGDSE